jgi:hypothetical protein
LQVKEDLAFRACPLIAVLGHWTIIDGSSKPGRFKVKHKKWKGRGRGKEDGVIPAGKNANEPK